MLIGEKLTEESVLFEPVTADDIRSAGVNELLADVKRLDRSGLLEAIKNARVSAEAATDQQGKVLRMLDSLMSLHLYVDMEGDSCGPQFLDNEERTAILSDFAGEQALALAEVASEILHPALRARFADVAYENRIMRSGREAIEAYCEVAQRIIDGDVELEFPGIGTRSMDAVRPLLRSMKISARVCKRGSPLPSLVRTARNALVALLAEEAFYQAADVAGGALRGSVLPPKEVEEILVSGLAELDAPGHALAKRNCWLVVAQAREWLGDEEGVKQARVCAAEQTLAMADQLGQFAAKAHWVKRALQEFRSLGYAEQRVAQLRIQLREVQEKSLEEFVPIRYPLDGFGDDSQKVYEYFSRLPLDQGMRSILRFVTPSKVDELKNLVRELAKKSPLSHIFTASYIDANGRQVAEGAHFDGSGDPSDDWYKENIIRDLPFIRAIRARAQFEPARLAIHERFSISTVQLDPIVEASPFVPAGHHEIFSLGLARLWQGDYVTACHLLLPQVENSIRHVLQMSGCDTAKIMENGLEGDRSLNMLLTTFEAKLEAIFGQDLVWEIDSLLNFRAGPSLRNALAHGQLTWTDCYSSDMINACWLVYLLVAYPLHDRWHDLVAPHLIQSGDFSQPLSP